MTRQSMPSRSWIGSIVRRHPAGGDRHKDAAANRLVQGLAIRGRETFLVVEESAIDVERNEADFFHWQLKRGDTLRRARRKSRHLGA
jgi:hypothetical protein